MDKHCTASQYSHYDVIIIGAGASGLYCALTAGRRGRRVLVLDHANKAGKKILMSGGGRCNFTNYFVEPEHFIGSNPHFCKSALSRYPSWEFIGMVEQHKIPYHEREHGQLFCDDSAQDILTMLLDECAAVGVQVRLNSQVDSMQALENDKKARFQLLTSKALSKKEKQEKKEALENAKSMQTGFRCESLVVATGGLSIPTMGASGLGYELAQQFGHSLITTDASLVPFTFTDKTGELIRTLAGISLPVIASNDRISFKLPLLFTHRGLSGPAMLQLSNYWHTGETISINLLPNIDITTLLLAHKKTHPRQLIRTVLTDYTDNALPKKLLVALQTTLWDDIKDKELANIKDERLIELGITLNGWQLKPSGTEGYRTAEVTRGGIKTDEVSSKTMQSNYQDGLYFIGEVLDVTGWLGGYNFQWAWASGFVCGEIV
ncbi:NAD(P)/FAD-dependent oxidoreductase [Psychrobacter cryohalolentis]|uniref:HI0933-like protein n=1 Tax=Psychrobacter cryohalolentis (strain ATCC BAA-1226 / DSM 17306 / VKM B-2378 / K5) TaxID=335284 RepID=Q1QEB7_PSYCK|nr:NAD(P)/FAD-dependent oxidoreductase [Psychrobacter cryohalolentis]ABE73986.1 HI0933-like protein [Psychrobacter cryohalolentis K5]ASE26621.1 NAD(P)/FAD-dependent oxidoreductase [Psychrobacter cryohalolentis]